MAVSIISLVVSCQAKDDTNALRAKDAREEQIKQITLAITNDEKGIKLGNPTGAPITKIVVRLSYSQNQYRYVTLKTLDPCMFWQLTDTNLKVAKPKLPPLPGGGTNFISGSTSVEVSLRDAKDVVWTKVVGVGYRPGGYWKTGFNTDHQSGSFVQNTTTLPSTSWDNLGHCPT